MKCKKLEKLMMRSFDGRLTTKEKDVLESHLKSCSLCQSKKEDYKKILDFLKEQDFPKPKPYFWERLKSRLHGQYPYEPIVLWKQWTIKAIPVSFLIAVLIAVTTIFLLPSREVELSQSEELFFRDLSPIQETITALEGEEIENKNMMLIFASIEEQNGIRRYLP